MTELTPRQMEVLARLAGPDEPTYLAAAHSLGIAEGTIRNHVSKALKRLGVHTTTGAWAALGWLRPPSLEDARALGVDLRDWIDPDE